jgi:glycosyltransferase involved in cell wall biosynthesis
MRISVCIPSVRPTTIEQAVGSILVQTFEDWELVVVGQGDEAALREATERAARGDARVRYLHSARRGASVARNVGAGATTGEVIAFMDDDCEADRAWLATLDEAFRDDVGLVCGSVFGPPDTGRRFVVCPTVEPADLIYDPLRMAEPPEGFGVLGANIAVRRTDFVRTGPFDECMGPGSSFQGGEEHDYVTRLTRLGVRLRSTPASIVHHTFGARYGVRAVYAHKRERIRGDGAVAAKGTMLESPGGGRSVNGCVASFAKAQSRHWQLRRPIMTTFRLFHYLKSYRECLRGFALSSSEPVQAVLVPRGGSASRSVTAPVLAAGSST